MPNTPIEPGNIYLDRDRRMTGRCVKVLSLDASYAYCEDSKQKRVRIKRTRLATPRLFRLVTPSEGV